jgi:heat shock protein HspQ
MSAQEAKFRVGQLVRHKLFAYRGVVFDVDPTFQGTDAWYDQMARSRPPRDRPWYHVLVHDAVHTTYVAERNLEPDFETAPIRHPQVDDHFSALGEDGYIPASRRN